MLQANTHAMSENWYLHATCMYNSAYIYMQHACTMYISTFICFFCCKQNPFGPAHTFSPYDANSLQTSCGGFSCTFEKRNQHILQIAILHIWKMAILHVWKMAILHIWKKCIFWRAGNGSVQEEQACWRAQNTDDAFAHYWLNNMQNGHISIGQHRIFAYLCFCIFVRVCIISIGDCFTRHLSRDSANLLFL